MALFKNDRFLCLPVLIPSLAALAYAVAAAAVLGNPSNDEMKVCDSKLLAKVCAALRAHRSSYSLDIIAAIAFGATCVLCVLSIFLKALRRILKWGGFAGSAFGAAAVVAATVTYPSTVTDNGGNFFKNAPINVLWFICSLAASVAAIIAAGMGFVSKPFKGKKGRVTALLADCLAIALLVGALLVIDYPDIDDINTACKSSIANRLCTLSRSLLASFSFEIIGAVLLAFAGVAALLWKLVPNTVLAAANSFASVVVLLVVILYPSVSKSKGVDLFADGWNKSWFTCVFTAFLTSAAASAVSIYSLL